jgi:hypothetical protein
MVNDGYLTLGLHNASADRAFTLSLPIQPNLWHSFFVMAAKSEHQKTAEVSRLISIAEVSNQVWDTLAIPSFAGTNPVTARYQRRTQIQYIFLAAVGLLSFYRSTDVRVRVAGLSCLFPGAGFLAVGGIAGTIGFLLSVAFVPLSIFAWFGAGGLAFVLANWIVPGVVSTAIAKKSVWEPSAPIIVIGVVALIGYVVRTSQQRHDRALKLRDSRNALLDREQQAWRARTEKGPDDSHKREMSIEDLRMLQHFIQVAHQSMDDWSNFSHVDQFQTAAFRYQLYGLQWVLACIQKYWMPNYHGHLKSAQEKLIDKAGCA